MVTLPSNMFTSVTLPAMLWFFDKAKKKTDKKDEILFIDARNIFTQVDRAHRKFSEEQIQNLSIISKLYDGDKKAFVDLLKKYEDNLSNSKNEGDKKYWQDQIEWLKERFPDGKYNDVIGLCKVVRLDEEEGIIEQDYSLNPGRYVGVVIEDDGLTNEEFKSDLNNLKSTYNQLEKEDKELSQQLDEIFNIIIGE